VYTRKGKVAVKGKIPELLRLKHRFLPLTPLLLCPFVTLQRSEFRVDGVGDNSTVTFPRYLRPERTPVTFDPWRLGVHSGQWRLSEDGEKLWLCVDLYRAVFPQRVVVVRRERGGTPLTRQVVSAVCGGVSVLCLLLTLVTYSLFSSLRALPGLNNMGLSASLGLAQLSLLLPWHRTGSATVCQLVGMLTHWLWLQAFGWMAVCCVHMARVFTANTRLVMTIRK
jgi:hypothetical protein